MHDTLSLLKQTRFPALQRQRLATLALTSGALGR